MSKQLYEEVKANSTWYGVNSNYHDPMYQYYYKLEQELYWTVISPPSNFNTVDMFVVNDKSKILQFGNYQCSAPGKEAYMDSALSCFLFQLPFFLEKIQIGYFGFVVVLPIILISLFGGIKESYRWFILNQAIWDLFVCYDFICAKPTLLGWSSQAYSSQTTCFYYQINSIYLNKSVHPVIEIATTGFRYFLRIAPFIPMFLLAFSRFLAMYFSRFYKSFTKSGFKIFGFMLIFNVSLVLMFCTPVAWSNIFVLSVHGEYEKCTTNFCPSRNTTFCMQNVTEYFQCYNRANAVDRPTFPRLLIKIQYFIPPTFFLLSIICVVLLFYKIASQMKFQLKTNKKSFNQTLKISTVVGFQCLIMSVIFAVTAIQKFIQFSGSLTGTYSMYTEIPPWLFLLQYCTTIASLNMIRVFLDSFLVLSILSGYSKCVVGTLKFMLLWVFNPKMAFKKLRNFIKNGNSKINVTITPITGTI